MKENIQFIIDGYLKKFPNEKERLKSLINFLELSLDNEFIDWNNQKGHITVGAFVYCKSENKFLMLFHKDLKMFLYPGGHVDKEDQTLLEAACRELREETGLENLELLRINDAEIPFDIDTHLIPINERVGMPEHYHFDFRYLFLVKTLDKITYDEDEFNKYKWVTIEELGKDKNYVNIIYKLNKFLKN